MQTVRKPKKLFGFTYTLPEGRQAYYFLLVEARKELILRQRLAKEEALDLLDYGKLVASGYGNPSVDLCMYLKKQYGQP